MMEQMKSEIDVYLEEDAHICDEEFKFDALE